MEKLHINIDLEKQIYWQSNVFNSNYTNTSVIILILVYSFYIIINEHILFTNNLCRTSSIN